MYTYSCKILRIVDGDTVDVDIDLGFGVWMHRERVRMYGIDTPESRTRDKIEKKARKIRVTKKKISEYLGAPRFYSDIAERTTKPGVVTGLAWTAAGGDILFIEASQMKGKGNLTLTGQLGDVMKESATAAMTFVRSNSRGASFLRVSIKNLKASLPTSPITSPSVKNVPERFDSFIC